MQAYTQDFLDRVLRALERGNRPNEIAKWFEVSRIWVYQVQGRGGEPRAMRSTATVGRGLRGRDSNCAADRQATRFDLVRDAAATGSNKALRSRSEHCGTG